MGLKLLFLFFVIWGCAHEKPNYQQHDVPSDKALITIYWPRQWQTQWGEYDVYFNEVPAKRLKNEGYFQQEIPPGKVVIKTHHFQDTDFIVLTTLDAKPGKSYFFKIDTQPEDVTALGIINDVMSISTVVTGYKSEMKLQSGNATWKDLRNKIKKEEALEEMKDQKAMGHHVLVATEEKVAQDELIQCCSSTRTAKVEVQEKELVAVKGEARDAARKFPLPYLVTREKCTVRWEVEKYQEEDEFIRLREFSPECPQSFRELAPFHKAALKAIFHDFPAIDLVMTPGLEILNPTGEWNLAVAQASLKNDQWLQYQKNYPRVSSWENPNVIFEGILRNSRPHQAFLDLFSSLKRKIRLSDSEKIFTGKVKGTRYQKDFSAADQSKEIMYDAGSLTWKRD